ncbi:MAG: amidohydrolase family protein [Proteobacteria bacterium]|nr:amidohydrolase family protein [Pseudomonadota bacterium]MDA1325179.1 amidohydrolase family protein [Pseudomonadota bacterium]
MPLDIKSGDIKSGRSGPTRAAEIRSRLKHPVIDADAHAIEFGPVYLDFLKQVAGPKVADRFLSMSQAGGWYGLTPQQRLDRRVARPSAWTMPTRNVVDRATAMMPRLFRARMDDFGLDFSIVYSTLALFVARLDDEELRRATCRALNTMFADIYGEHADRMAPVAAIPAHTPQEAIEELDHAVNELGFKAVMINSNVRRPLAAVADQAPEFARYATWMDTLCMESAYDYDPLWARCVDLRVAVTAHSPSVGYGSRVVTNHYIHNHVGSFAAAGEAFAKALVLGGVTQRFPTLNFAFLEGGVAWASELYAGLVGHCEKRNPTQIGNIDPQNLDLDALADLFAEYGQGLVDGRPDPNDPYFSRWPGGWHWPEDDMIAHELDNLGIKSGEDLRDLFEPRFYFGCEADDPLVALGFDGRMNPFGARLKAMFSSDIGHWDVPDMTRVLEEAYELVERELLDDDDFHDFVFAHAAGLHGGMNPDFFKGTVVEDEVSRLLK